MEPRIEGRRGGGREERRGKRTLNSGGKSRRWQASSGTLLQQCKKVRADVLVLAWTEGRAHRFCWLVIRALEPRGRELLSNSSGSLQKYPADLCKSWYFGKTAKTVDNDGLLAAVTRIFKKYSSEDK